MKKAVVTFLILGLVCGAPLSQYAARPAKVKVRLLSGQSYSGVLLKVDDTALTLHEKGNAQLLTVALQEVMSIDLHSGSKFWPGLAIGLAGGVCLAGIPLDFKRGEDLEAMAYPAFSLLGLLVGGITGAVISNKDTISLAGLSGADRDRALARLNRWARFPGRLNPASETSPEREFAEQPFSKRFRLFWMPALSIVKESYGNDDYANQGYIEVGHARLDYDLNPYFSAGLEWGGYVTENSIQSVLLTVAYRPKPLSSDRRFLPEINLSVGPAWLKESGGKSYPEIWTTGWSGKLGCGFDYPLMSRVQLGMYVEYQALFFRHLQIRAPETSLTTNRFAFGLRLSFRL